MKDEKNNTDTFFCLSEKQTTWCIASSIVLLCITILCSYIVGYRSAMRQVVDSAKKDSFTDQLYTSVLASTMDSSHLPLDEGYYIQCKACDKDDAHHIMQLAKKEGLTLSIMNTVTPTEDNAKNTCYLVSPVVGTDEEVNTMVRLLTNKANIHQYDIIKVQKTQKLKGYLS